MENLISKIWKSKRFNEEREGFSHAVRFLPDDECYPVEINMGNLPPKDGYVIGEEPPVRAPGGAELTESYLQIYLGRVFGIQGVHRDRIKRKESND